MRNMRTGGELERLPPVENFLASHMPLENKCWSVCFQSCAYRQETRTELLMNGGRLCTNIRLARRTEPQTTDSLPVQAFKHDHAQTPPVT